jgi:cell division protein FtsW (lipid II flippase)
MSKATERIRRVLGRSPISVVNTVLVLTFLLASVGMTLLGDEGLALIMAYLGLAGVGVALYARRPTSSDVTRLNAIEYRDERDRSLASQAFAAVGVAALIILFVACITMMFLERFDWYLFAILMSLLVVWSVANSVVVRRR